MQILNPTNPRYGDSENSTIILDIELEGLEGTHNFIAREDDIEEIGRDLYTKSKNGDFGTISDYVPVPVIPIVPDQISDRQFFQQLAIQNIISKEDALNAVKTGFIPNALQSIIDTMPEENKFAAEMLLSGATIFQRNHPLTDAIGQTYGMSPTQIDEFFINANKL